MEENLETDIIGWCKDRLDNSDDYFIPLNVLCKDYCAQTGNKITLENFRKILASDPIFYLTPGQQVNNGSSDQGLLSQLGLPATSLVGLSGRKPSSKELDDAIRAKAIHMRFALRKAWEARPLNDVDAEERLLFLMEQADKLCEALGVDDTEDN